MSVILLVQFTIVRHFNLPAGHALCMWTLFNEGAYLT